MFFKDKKFKWLAVATAAALITGVTSCNNSLLTNDESENYVQSERNLQGSSGENKSAVMLQGFNWSSANGSWYSEISSKSGDIKNNFDYVWFPPASASCDKHGYLPTQLNDLNSVYGKASDLKSAINAIKPAKAIADVVINHRCGTTSWGDFTNPKWCDDYYAICSNDEGFSDSSSPMTSSGRRGNNDTGEGYSAGRDLDHTNYQVQQGIVTWMNTVLRDAGFVGWRYDFVKGYSGYYVGKYNSETNAEFSVGEYWPSAGFSPYNSYAWRSEIENWINSTASGGYKTRAFDFVLKGNLNYAFGYKENPNLWDMTRLADSNNLFRSNPAYAVTFIDNHDTGSTQGHWPIDSGDLGPAYAFILTHPGVPCVAWQHYFTGNESQYLGGASVSGTGNNLHQHINQLIKYRKDYGICYDSAIEVLYSARELYAAKITGTKGSLVVAIGGASYSCPSGYKAVYSGTNFKIFASGGEAVVPETPDTGKIIVHVPTSLNYNYIWAWNPSNTSVNYTGSKWPGVKLSNAENGYYSYTINASKAGVIFSNNGSSKTVDLSISAKGEYWYVGGANGTGTSADWSDKAPSTGTTTGTTSGTSTGTTGSTTGTTTGNTGSSTGTTSGSSTGTTTGTTTGSNTSSETEYITVTLKAVYNAGYSNGIYFTGTFNEADNWKQAVRGKYSSGNVWTATVTCPKGTEFRWKAMKGRYSYGEKVPVSYLSWESGSDHTSTTTTVYPNF